MEGLVENCRQMYRLGGKDEETHGSTASKSARGGWYVSSHSEDDLPHTILQQWTTSTNALRNS